jgi:hypothetical protein
MRSVRLLAFACFCAALPEAAVAQDWKFSSSVNYDTGKYGGPDRTDSVYIPFTLKRYYSEGDLSVTLPLLRQSSSGQVTRVGGKPVRAVKGSVSAATAAESGLGDIMVRGSYIIKRDGPRSFDLAAAGRLKLPTANKNKGLGTGEIDQGAGFEFAKELTPGVSLLADGYYTIIGDLDGVDFNNEVSVDIGVSKTLRQNLSLTVLYATQSAITDGNADPRELSGTLDYKSSDGNHYHGGLLLGLSDGSPDAGFSAGFSRRF